MKILEAKCQMPMMSPVIIPTKNTKLLKRVINIFKSRKWIIQQNWIIKIRIEWKSSLMSTHIIRSDLADSIFNEREITLIIPKGFMFDGASIPRPFWAILNPSGILFIPSVIHDYAYKYGTLWQVVDCNRIAPAFNNLGKDFYDKLFFELGKQINGTTLPNWIAWIAIKFGGRIAWNRRRKEMNVAKKPVIISPQIIMRSAIKKVLREEF